MLATAPTDDDGRLRFTDDLSPGEYRLCFATGDWFAAAGRDTFFGAVEVPARLAGPHVHVALLLSPFAYTTYRGS